jgi:hypothetical protein
MIRKTLALAALMFSTPAAADPSWLTAVRVEDAYHDMVMLDADTFLVPSVRMRFELTGVTLPKDGRAAQCPEERVAAHLMRVVSRELIRRADSVEFGVYSRASGRDLWAWTASVHLIIDGTRLDYAEELKKEGLALPSYVTPTSWCEGIARQGNWLRDE